MRLLCVLLLPILSGCAGSGISTLAGEDGRPQLSMRSIDPVTGRGEAVELRWRGGPHIGFRWHF